MGIVLDSSILIAAERRRETISQVIQGMTARFGDTPAAISAVTIVELTHGIYRAKTDAACIVRRSFVDELCRDMTIYPLTLEIAQLGGRIEGEQAALGNIIAFPDLLIGATALHLGFSVATLNRRHFERIPDLKVVTL